MRALIPKPRSMEGFPITLCLHEIVFQSPFFRVTISPPSQCIIHLCVSEVIECKVLYAIVVALVEVNVLRVANVVVLPVVRSRQHLHSISHEVPVKLH